MVLFNRLLPGVFAMLALLCGLEPAFADTIDAGAKPYIVGGCFLIGVGLAVAGAFFLSKGISRQRAAAAIATAPSVDGKVITSGIVERLDDDDGVKTKIYTPSVRYSYVVGGATYESNVVRLGLGDFGYASEIKAREHADRYPVGATVPVRYDPANPRTAALEAGQTGGGRFAFAGILLLLAAAGALAVAGWALSLEAG